MFTTLVALTACASSPSLPTLAQAITLHNTTRHIVMAADEAYTPIYGAAYDEASRVHPDDDAALHEALRPYDAMVEALSQAKLLEQSLYLAVDQWQQGLDDGTMTREAAACSGSGLEALAAHAAEIPSVGPYIYAAVQTLAFQLTRLADGAACPVRAVRPTS
jgi:hypothetical protein